MQVINEAPLAKAPLGSNHLKIIQGPLGFPFSFFPVFCNHVIFFLYGSRTVPCYPSSSRCCILAVPTHSVPASLRFLLVPQITSVFYPKSAVHDPGNSPSQTRARLPAPSLPSVQQPAPARLNKLLMEPERGKGAKPLGSWLPAPGSRSSGCWDTRREHPKPRSSESRAARRCKHPSVFRRRKWCFEPPTAAPGFCGNVETQRLPAFCSAYAS